MSQQHFTLHWGLHALLKLVADHQFKEVLDIGSGQGQHKKFLEYFDKEVFSVDMATDADYCGDFLEIDFDRQFDAVWCSHVLEHQRNVGLFLDRIYSVLKPGGILAIIVPTHEREVMISGHLTSWSIPLLCYNLITAGFDCASANILNTYELSLIVEKKEARHSDRNHNSVFGREVFNKKTDGKGKSDPFSHIAQFFPYQATQGAKVAGIGGVNWDNILEYTIKTSKEIPTFESKNLTNSPALTPVLKSST